MQILLNKLDPPYTGVVTSALAIHVMENFRITFEMEIVIQMHASVEKLGLP